jgi:hypothetical protein
MEADKRCGLAYNHQNLAGASLDLCTQSCATGGRI